jgi:carboxyl-terminal processing protease
MFFNGDKMGKSFKYPFLFVILTLGIVLGIQIEKVFSGDNLREGIRKFNDVLTYTEKFYIEEVDTPMLVEEAVKGMFNQLDPHSVYIPAKQFENIEESFRGDFEGIGIEFQVVNDTLTVVSPITGGPSEALGIMSGDRIIKIEGEDCIGITNEEVRNKLRGEAGTKVTVSIIRTGVDESIEYVITRDKIPIYSVDSHFMYDDKIGYVSVSRFSETTYDELKEALNDLNNSGMEQLVLDLRGNPGGYLNQAVKISDLFIDGDKRIVYTRGRKEEFDEDYFASRSSEFEKVPLIILINKGSASASEIVSGAVQDWDRGLIAGETSFGKGLVQRQFPLFDNSAVRLTISKYYTPTGRSIQRNYENKEDYYSELGDREEKESNNITHTAEKDSLRPVFTTEGGRKVYGGGGITPDYIIPSEKLSDYTRDLLRNNIFYQFILKYIEKNGESLSSRYGDDLQKFRRDFSFTTDEQKQFIDFAKDKDVSFMEEDFAESKDYIFTRLKAQLARNYWKNEGWYTILLDIDTQFLKSVTLFDEAKDLANLK